MSCIKRLALLEPLVDTCDSAQVMSESCQVLDLDLYRVTKADLDFKTDFELKITRDDFCHALVAYFNVEFSKSHTRLRFSTGPRSKYTHWKQTVFYLEDEMVASAGDVITGTISVARNPRNPRDIDIQITTAKNGSNPRAPYLQQYHLR